MPAAIFLSWSICSTKAAPLAVMLGIVAPAAARGELPELLGLGVIVFTIVITGLYVRRANSQYDRLAAEVNASVLK